MRVRFFLGLLCCTMAAVSCAQQKKTTASPSTSDKSKPTSSITAMTMRRGACFGKCPIYEVHLSADGNVRYVGEMFTNYLGTFEKNIGAEKAAQLFRQFETHRVDTCKSEYDVMIPDLPGITYTFTRSGATQRIANAHFGPFFLQQLADSVDAVVQVDKSWKKTADPKKQ